MKKKVAPFVTTLSIAMLLLGTFPAIASGGWSEDVNQLGWEIVNMTNNTTNGVLDILTGFVSGTTGGQFDINYKQFVENGHWEYTDTVVDVPGHYAACAEGWEVDPENEAQCRRWVESEVCEDVCPTDQVFTASREVCPADDSAYIYTDWHPCWRFINHHLRFADKVTETFSVTFDYNKWAQDPHKCHRPTAESLDIPSWAVHDFNRKFPEWKCVEEVCTDTSHYEYMEREWIPDTYTCPASYEEDPENTEQCLLWIDTSGYEYVEREWIPDTYACPAGYEPNPEGENCRKWVDESAWIYQTLTYYIEVPEKKKTPVCDPFEGCVGVAGLWENIMGGFETGPSLYGTGPQTMDVTWTSADICKWDGTGCEPSQPFVAIKVRSVVGQTSDTQTSFTVKVKGVDYPAEVVHAADGVDWYVLRFQIDGYPLYSGVNVISDKGLWLMDDTGSQHWWKTNGVVPRVYKDNQFPESCSDAPDFGDTRIENGVMEMGRFPGANTSDVIHFLVLNNVPYDEAETWATETWHALAFGEYAPVPASFSPVAP